MADTHLYFAYGSNLSRSQMAIRCPGSSCLDAAVLHGYRLDFTTDSGTWGGGVADVVEDGGNSVWGLLYSVTDDDLNRLDYYEGFPTKYDRIRATVEQDQGSVEDVWVYVVVDKRDFIQPSLRYLDIITSATEEFEFPAKYRQYLDSIETTES
ncbi:MAG TPA: gamma-glutamylcyclotransferase family protein [Chloroflexota bacterium]|nr:gamma-glutamylcyclotransferase family protein [Chloroflexota bacterium]